MKTSNFHDLLRCFIKLQKKKSCLTENYIIEWSEGVGWKQTNRYKRHVNSWVAYVEQSGNKKKLANILSKVSQNNSRNFNSHDGGISYWKHNDIICWLVFSLHVCNKYTKPRPNVLLITVHLKLVGVSSGPGVTTNVNVGGGEMTTSTGLKSLKCQDNQLDNIRKTKTSQTTEWERAGQCKLGTTAQLKDLRLRKTSDGY